MNKRLASWISIVLAIIFVPATSNARWLNVNTGRFQTMDSYEGNKQEPQSLHKYLYAHANPINLLDPSGHDPLSCLLNGKKVHKLIGEDFKKNVEGGIYGPSVSTILGLPFTSIALFPDLVDVSNKKVFEIKTTLGFPVGILQLNGYLQAFNYFDPGWSAGTDFDYCPPSQLYLGLGTWATVFPPVQGVIAYDVVDVPSLSLLAVGVMYQLSQTLGVATLNATLGAY